MTTPMQQEDVELVAIRRMLEVLDPLDSEARERVVSYVFQRLGVTAMPSRLSTPNEDSPISTLPPGSAQPTSSSTSSSTDQPTDIRSLRQAKQPRSANEMAALVAYYLSEVAPPHERTDRITAADVRTYFKQAGFPLPKAPTQTLPNAKNAGYLDSVGHGAYRINPVGHNLIVHSLPPEEESGRPALRPRRRAPRRPKKTEGPQQSQRSRKASTKRRGK